MKRFLHFIYLQINQTSALENKLVELLSISASPKNVLLRLASLADNLDLIIYHLLCSYFLYFYYNYISISKLKLNLSKLLIHLSLKLFQPNYYNFFKHSQKAYLHYTLIYNALISQVKPKS